MYGRKYSTAEKLAYYKSLAKGARATSNYGSRSGRTAGYTRTVSGRGDYYTRFKSNYRKPYRYPGAGRRLGAAAGSYIGNAISPGIGGAIGRGIGGGIGQLAHAGIKTISGYGDYQVKSNSVIYNKDAVPQFSAANPRCTILCHSEFIRDIYGSSNFQLDALDINATNSACFPWLSQIAQNFEQVVWQGLVFQYKPTCGDAIGSTNNAMGTIIMATQYDTLSPVFVNKQQMENYEFAQSGKPSDAWLHAIECDPALTLNQGLFYTDNPANSNINADPRLYNIGRFNIATQGMQASVVIGELWVTYKVCLLKPKLTGQVNFSDHWILDGPNVDALNPFGDDSELSSTSTSYQASQLISDQQMTAIKTSPWGSSSGGTVIYFNPSFSGRALIVYELHNGASTATLDPVCNAGSNGLTTVMTSPSSAAGGFNAYVKDSVGAVTPDVLCAWVIDVKGGILSNAPPHVSITLLGYTANSGTTGNLAIYAIPSNLSD